MIIYDVSVAANSAHEQGSGATGNDLTGNGLTGATLTPTNCNDIMFSVVGTDDGGHANAVNGLTPGYLNS